MQTNTTSSSRKYITKYEYAISNQPIEVSHFDVPCSIQKVISHEDSSLFLTTDGNVYALGRNKEFQFGISGDCKIPTRLSVTDVLDIGFRHRLLVLQRGNVLLGCGSNANFALGFVTSQSPIRELTELPKHVYRNENVLFVASGHSFSVIVTAENNLYMMGQK
jgi:alpha-tubulin suppressor-like RCC1 family protein